MKIAVTGGSGKLGRALTPVLAAHGHTVLSLDIVAPAEPAAGVTYQTVSVSEYGALKATMQGCDALMHLAALLGPRVAPEPGVYDANTNGSYHVLAAAEALGINRVCLASSINAIGGIYSREPRYDYFPLDERHPAYPEDAYSLSKWVLEQQGNAFARRNPGMQIASMRFHGLIEPTPDVRSIPYAQDPNAHKHLWGYTDIGAAVRACEAALSADFGRHEAFYIVAPVTTAYQPSLELAQQYFPATPVRGDLAGFNGFFDCRKAGRLLGWKHEI
jgi:nucleoside-diphosphate-sugar epimerase